MEKVGEVLEQKCAEGSEFMWHAMRKNSKASWSLSHS